MTLYYHLPCDQPIGSPFECKVADLADINHDSTNIQSSPAYLLYLSYEFLLLLFKVSLFLNSFIEDLYTDRIQNSYLFRFKKMISSRK